MKFSTNIVIEADTIQKEMKLQYDIEMEDPRYVLFGEYAATLRAIEKISKTYSINYDLIGIESKIEVR